MVSTRPNICGYLPLYFYPNKMRPTCEMRFNYLLYIGHGLDNLEIACLMDTLRGDNCNIRYSLLSHSCWLIPCQDDWAAYWITEAWPVIGYGRSCFILPTYVTFSNCRCSVGRYDEAMRPINIRSLNNCSGASQWLKSRALSCLSPFGRRKFLCNISL